ncbi:MAG: dockerin type I domain-containing protein [Desulfobacterales bacterium]
MQKGDTNRDGKINLGDLITVLQVCAGMNPEVCKASDANRDGIISMEEAIWLLRMTAGTDD